MGIKIFHTADIHIGLKFSGRDYSPEIKSKLQAEPLDCLGRMVETANLQKCDLFIIAGDMFDKISIPKTDIHKAADILNSFNGTHVVVLPGNHDFYENRSGSLWDNFIEKINEHLIILLTNKEPYELQVRDEKLILYPGPCKTKHSAQNEISWVKDIRKDENTIHIGIAHGSVENLSPDLDQNYFPIKLSEIKESGVDFWLLGHTHIRFPESGGQGNPMFFMPSTPAPDGFDCTHDGFAWCIDIMGNKFLRYESIKTGRFSFKTLRKEINSKDDIIKLKEEALKFDTNTTLMKLKLTGRLSQDEISMLPQLFEYLFQTFAYIEIDAGDIALNIDNSYIDKVYTENSLPYRMLKKLASNPENYLALQLAHKLIEEAKG